jgi:hypothetical protein
MASIIEQENEAPNSAIRKGSQQRIERAGLKVRPMQSEWGELPSCGSVMSPCRHNVQTKCRNVSNKSAMYGMNLVLQYQSVTAVLLLIPRSPAPRVLAGLRPSSKEGVP